MKIDKWIFHVDFVILDVGEDLEIPLILSRPFLATSKAIIVVSDGRMVLRVGDEEVEFKLPDAVKLSLDFDDSCYFLDAT